MEVVLDHTTIESDVMIEILEDRGYSITYDLDETLLNIALDRFQCRRLLEVLDEHGVSNSADYRIYDEVRKLVYG